MGTKNAVGFVFYFDLLSDNKHSSLKRIIYSLFIWLHVLFMAVKTGAQIEWQKVVHPKTKINGPNMRTIFVFTFRFLFVIFNDGIWARKNDITFIKSPVNFPILKMQFNSPAPKGRDEVKMQATNLYDRICNLSEFNCAISATIFLCAFFSVEAT